MRHLAFILSTPSLSCNDHVCSKCNSEVTGAVDVSEVSNRLCDGCLEEDSSAWFMSLAEGMHDMEQEEHWDRISEEDMGDEILMATVIRNSRDGRHAYMKEDIADYDQVIN